MTDNHGKLLKLDNNKLIDIVKNFRQYGYDDQLRNTAIDILADRGITREQLEVTGSFENNTYDYANDLFTSFLKNSKIAFVSYLVLFSSRALSPILPIDSVILATSFLILTILAFILYLVFLLMSFMNQSNFYKVIGRDYGSEGALVYLFLGLPFYMVLYFYFRNQMREKMREIS